MWEDYRFVLVPGEPVERITPDVICREVPPFMERHHGTELGVVFFPTLADARAYQRELGLLRWNVVGLRVEAGALVRRSVDWWGCNVAYSVCVVGSGFRRDVTEITGLPHDN